MFRHLLCAFKLGHIGDISKQTVSGWIRQLIKQAYSAVQDEDIPHLTHTNFQARELRAFAYSLAFHQNYSLKQVMEAASWRNNNTFVSFYLRDLSQMGDVTTAGPSGADPGFFPRGGVRVTVPQRRRRRLSGRYGGGGGFEYEVL